ncbi:AMP-binding protein [Roseomonas soli]|uniref:AMP-binding protein n=2 Tax=Neoroseomonas soli TaxID=1081025 RepID=A0A9X9WZW9_9PROT|nr:AMP-binding protein [Neoroseomonas soli]
MNGVAQPYIDPRMPPPDAMMPQLRLRHWADSCGDRVFAVFDDGQEWTYVGFRERVLRAAAGLHQAGIRQGDHVVTWLPNGPEALVFWFAINHLGAVFVPVNTAYRGRIVDTVLAIAGGAMLIAHHGLIGRLAAGAALPPRCVVVGGEGAPPPGWRPASDILDAGGAAPVPDREIMPWDTQSIVFTSGTTGPSKGVCQSYFQQYTIAVGAAFLSAEDRCLMTLPLYHQGGITGVNRMLFCGGSVAMAGPFTTDTFWPAVRRTRATSATLMGAMAKFLVGQPPSDEDRDHTLRNVIIAPLDEQEAFATRFGVDVYSVYNMTELGAPLVTEPNPKAQGTCGRVRPGFELRIVDENDCELPAGMRGELVVRHETPWALTSGYHRNPEATAGAWRNGWFHTGDCFSRDAAGNYFFVDRLKDTVRRRGENISSFEVEAEVLAFPSVAEAAVIGVPSKDSEQDLMAVLVPTPGAVVDPLELLRFLEPRLPHFMIPRYVRSVAALPKTASHKIQKQPLRDEGVAEGTWDREAAGVRIRRERL